MSRSALLDPGPTVVTTFGQKSTETDVVGAAREVLASVGVTSANQTIMVGGRSATADTHVPRGSEVTVADEITGG